jgi:apurinic endonuclease APN1
MQKLRFLASPDIFFEEDPLMPETHTLKRFWGCHVSSAGGLEKSIAHATALNINTIQIHPCPPQRWNTKPFAEGVEDAFISARVASPVEKLFFHGIYLINLASPDAAKRNLAKLSLMHDLDLNARMQGNGVIFHVGSMKDEPDMQAGLVRAAEVLNRIFDEEPSAATLLLEVAAGSGKVIGSKLEELRTIYDLVENKSRLGFALDTQHMWASGYDVAGKTEELITEIDAVFGLDKVKAIHLNDSKSALASRVDRHENIGDGQIGLEGMTRFIQHKKLIGIPMILETPAMKSMETAYAEVEKVRMLMQS